MENKEARLIKIKEEIYITTDEEIKEGDWAYNIVQRTYFMVSKSFMKIIGNTLPTNKKIIATTNTKLNLGICEDCKQDKDYRHNFIKCTCSLPQPSQAFIEAFCKAGGIWKVLVEYEGLNIPLGNQYVDISKISTSVISSNFYPRGEQKDYAPSLVKCCKSGKVFKTKYRHDLFPGYYDVEEVTNFVKPKVNSNNEITIHHIKNSWDKEEVTELLSSMSSYTHVQNRVVVGKELNNWIKENLS